MEGFQVQVSLATLTEKDKQLRPSDGLTTAKVRVLEELVEGCHATVVLVIYTEMAFQDQEAADLQSDLIVGRVLEDDVKSRLVGHGGNHLHDGAVLLETLEDRHQVNGLIEACDMDGRNLGQHRVHRQ